MVSQVTDLDAAELQPLIDESLADGFGFIQRLAEDYASGKHRFDGPQDALFTIRTDGVLVAVGGFTPDAYSGDPAVGRVRRVYVLAGFRRGGVGRALLGAIVEGARPLFETLVLRTDTERASRFYESIGFLPNAPYPDATHFIRLR